MQNKHTSLRFLSLLVLLLLASHVSAEVTSSYNSMTNTLTFSGSGDLTKVIVDNAPNIKTVSTVEIDRGVTAILNHAFYNRSNITRVDFAYATELTSIGDNAFYGCGLTSLTVPSTVTSIGRFAFLFNPLNTIVFKSSTETLAIGANAFTLGDGNGVVSTFECNRPFTYEGKWDYDEDILIGGQGIFQHENNLTYTFFGGNATIVPESSFYACRNLKIANLGGEVRTIEYNAFAYSALESLEVPSSVTSIGRRAFLGTPLKTIVFKPSQDVLAVGADAFTNHRVEYGVVESFTCNRDFTYEGHWNSDENRVEEGYGILRNQQHLTSVTIGGYTTTIPKFSFLLCHYLENITFSGQSLNTIEAQAFSYTGLKSLTVPSSVTSIKDNAFYKAPLTFIEFASTSTTLNLGSNVFSENSPSNHGVVEVFRGYRPFTFRGYGPFQYEDKLTNVTLLNMSSVDANTFTGCSNLTTLTIGGALAKATYTDSNNLADIFPYLQKLTINSGATSIGEYAFYDSPYLSSVTIPSTVTSIGEHAFDLCPNVTAMNFNTSSFDTWWASLQDCAASITDLNIPNDVIANHAWTNDDNLSTRFPNVINVTFGPAVTTLHDKIFYVKDANVTNKLKTVTFSSNVTLGWSAFCNNTQLESITSDKITTCGVTCFMNCKKLTDVNLSACDEIKTQAFYGCTGLTTMRLGSPLTTIASEAFRGCSNLKTLYINSPSYLRNRFADGSSVVNLFGDRLTTIYVQDDVQSIGSKAFAGTSTSPLSNLVIGTGVTSIASDAFAGNTQLTDVTIHSKSLASRTYTASSNLADVFPYLQNLTFGAEVDKVADYSFHVTSDENFPLAKVSFGKHADIGRSAFCNNKALTTIAGTVKSVYEYSFARTNIKSIEILEDDIIDAYAFDGCTSLSNVSLPRTTLTTIKEYAFNGCTSLRSVTLPSSLTTIQKYAFKECSLLNNVTIPYNVTTLEDYAFYYASSLTTLTINSSHILNPTTSYTSTSNLKSKFAYVQYLTINSGSEIGEYAFYGHTHLKTVNLSDVSTVGTFAFQGCTNLNTLTGTSLSTISKDAFKGCAALTTVTLPYNLRTLESGAFSGCTNLTSLTVNSRYLLNKTFTSSAPFYSEFPYVKNLTLGSAVTLVGDYAFEGSGLEEVTLSGRETEVGINAFCNSTSLTTINGSVKSVAIGSFQNTPISSIKITDDTAIDKNAFYGCSCLTSVELPSNLSTINSYAFFGCASLSGIILPARLTTILDKAFASCTSLAEITIPQNVSGRSLWQDSFERCTNLKTVNIESYTVADLSSYNSDNNLGTRFPYATNLNFGPNVTYLGNYAFYCHQNLEKVTFESTCTLRESSFEDCVGLKTIEGTIYPSYEGCLAGCTQLTDGFAITGTIGARAFQNCSSLTSIELPASTATIRDNAFDGCSGLTKVICNQTTPVALTNDMNVFANVPVANVELEVPYSAILKYKAAEVWKDFGDFFAIGGVKLQDGVAYTNEEDQDIPMIRYTRTFSSTQAGKWQAFLIPFDLNVEDYAEDFDFAQIYAICPTKDTNKDGQIDADDDKVMILSYKRSGTISANVPYMIRPKRALTAKFEVWNSTLNKAESHGVEFSSSVMKYSVNGIYQSFVAMPGDHNYYMSANGNLSFATEGSGNVNVGPYRWVMHEENQNYGGVDNNTNSSAASQIRICVLGEDLDEETAIRLISGDAISSTPVTDTYIYNLNGTRVDENAPLAKGMYIKQGKTIFVK